MIDRTVNEIAEDAKRMQLRRKLCMGEDKEGGDSHGDQG